MRALKSPGFKNPGQELSQVDIEDIRKLYNCGTTDKQPTPNEAILSELNSLKSTFFLNKHFSVTKEMINFKNQSQPQDLLFNGLKILKGF
jgi:hypothetical protein